jgi:phosphatidate cytidylyltransferase
MINGFLATIFFPLFFCWIINDIYIFLCSTFSPFPGFLASAVKRAFYTKDFGTLIPGHGGVLDRFDCHVVTAPFVYLYLRQFLGK